MSDMTSHSPASITLKRSEKDEERLGDSLMQQLGYTVIRFSQPRNTMQTEGIPDRRYYHPRFPAVWWEAKRVGGTQRKAQAAFEDIAEACDEVYVLGPFACLEAYVKWAHRVEAWTRPRPDIAMADPYRYRPKSRTKSRTLTTETAP